MASNKPVVQLDLDDLFKTMNETSRVKAGLMKKATDIANRARRIASAENSEAQISITEHWLRNGRLVMHVNSDDVDGEYGTSSTARRRTLRRAAAR